MTFKTAFTISANSSAEVVLTNQAGTPDFTWSLSEVDSITGRTAYKLAEVSATASNIYITIAPSDTTRNFTFNYTAIMEA